MKHSIKPETFIKAKQKFCKILDFAARHQRQEMGVPTISINYPWEEVSMYWSFEGGSVSMKLKKDGVYWSVDRQYNEHYGDKIDSSCNRWTETSELLKVSIEKVLK